MWGHLVPVLGAISPFLEPFRGRLSPNIDNVSEKLTLRYPHEGPWVVQRRSPPTLGTFSNTQSLDARLKGHLSTPHRSLGISHLGPFVRFAYRLSQSPQSAITLVGYRALQSCVAGERPGGDAGDFISKHLNSSTLCKEICYTSRSVLVI